MTREHLPDCRLSETFVVRHGTRTWPVTVSRFADGRVAEVFGTLKYGSGSDLETEARDASILLSLALQHGVPLETIGHALSRHADGRPCGVVGAIVDALLERKP